MLATSLKVDNKIFDHINNKFVDLNTPIGQQIKQLNNVCEICPSNKIYNPSTKRCVSKTGNLASVLKQEIEYCNKYDLYIKRTVDSDMKIIDNILNIRINNNLLPKNKKSFQIKDIFIENLKKSDPNLATRLNIKDLRIKGYINYLPTLFFALTQVINMNTDIRKFVLSSISNILSSIKNGILSTYLKIFTDYIKSPFLINLIANLSLTKFLVFISGMMVIITNLPSIMRNKSSVSRIAEVALTGKDGAPFTVNDKLLKYDVEKPVQLNETSKVIVDNLKAYNNTAKTVSLSKLGLNTRDIADKDTRINFSYDDSKQMAYAEVFTRTNRSSYYILPKQSRTEKLKEIKTKTRELNALFEEKKKQISDTRDNHSKYLKSLELSDTLAKLEEERSSLKKYTPMYNKYTSRVNKIQSELLDTQKYLKNKDYTPLDIKELSKLQPKMSSIVNWQSSLNKMYKETSQVNDTNFNVYYPIFFNTLDSAKNELANLNQPDIVITAKPITGTQAFTSRPVQITSVASQPISNITNNLSTINNNVTKKYTELDNLFDGVSDEEFTKSASKLSDIKRTFRSQKRAVKMLDPVSNNDNDKEFQKLLDNIAQGSIQTPGSPPRKTGPIIPKRKSSSPSSYEDYR